MNKTGAVILAALAILTSQGIAQEAQTQKTKAAAPVVTKYDRMEKNQLQEELKKLQREVFVAEQTAKQADAKREAAYQAYNTATEEQKPDALIRMLEADAQRIKPVASCRQVMSDFEAAKSAYLKLLIAEQK